MHNKQKIQRINFFRKKKSKPDIKILLFGNYRKKSVLDLSEKCINISLLFTVKSTDYVCFYSFKKI